MNGRINFQYEVNGFYFPNRNRLKSFLLQQILKEGYKVQLINYVFCSDAFLIGINRQYLNHDDYTDIITFDLSEPGQGISAEIYISIERVRENADSYVTSFINELNRVIFHGALHLCGYKDKTAEDQSVMRSMEDKWLGKWKMIKK